MFKVDLKELTNTNSKRILLVVKILITAVILALIITIGYQKIIKKVQYPSVLGYKFFIVMSNSMNPTLKEGDLIIVKVIDEEKIKVNNIATFIEDSGATITHRIVDITNENGIRYYFTKGDANDGAELGKVTYEQIEGVLWARLDGVGLFFVGNAKWITLFIILILGYVIIFLKDKGTDDEKIVETEENTQNKLEEKQVETEENFEENEIIDSNEEIKEDEEK